MKARNNSLPANATELLHVGQVAAMLQCNPYQVSRLVRQGMPAVDVAIARPGRRPKRSLRFDREKVLEWLGRRMS